MNIKRATFYTAHTLTQTGGGTDKHSTQCTSYSYLITIDTNILRYTSISYMLVVRMSHQSKSLPTKIMQAAEIIKVRARERLRLRNDRPRLAPQSVGKGFGFLWIGLSFTHETEACGASDSKYTPCPPRGFASATRAQGAKSLIELILTSFQIFRIRLHISWKISNDRKDVHRCMTR